jgi:hypothetical protein
MIQLNSHAQDKIKEENGSKGGVIRPTPRFEGRSNAAFSITNTALHLLV